MGGLERVSLAEWKAGPDLPPPNPDVPCCEASANNPDVCTCWEPIYDRPPMPAGGTLAGPSAPRPRMCGDCAYRPGSPERLELDGAQLEAPLSQVFLCHDGMPKLLGWTHPELPGVCLRAAAIGDRDNYGPVVRGPHAWQADGTPALVCGGWMAVSGARR